MPVWWLLAVLLYMGVAVEVATMTWPQKLDLLSSQISTHFQNPDFEAGRFAVVCSFSNNGITAIILHRVITRHRRHSIFLYVPSSTQPLQSDWSDWTPRDEDLTRFALQLSFPFDHSKPTVVDSVGIISSSSSRQLNPSYHTMSAFTPHRLDMLELIKAITGGYRSVFGLDIGKICLNDNAKGIGLYQSDSGVESSIHTPILSRISIARHGSPFYVHYWGFHPECFQECEPSSVISREESWKAGQEIQEWAAATLLASLLTSDKFNHLQLATLRRFYTTAGSDGTVTVRDWLENQVPTFPCSTVKANEDSCILAQEFVDIVLGFHWNPHLKEKLYNAMGFSSIQPEFEYCIDVV